MKWKVEWKLKTSFTEVTTWKKTYVIKQWAAETAHETDIDKLLAIIVPPQKWIYESFSRKPNETAYGKRPTVCLKHKQIFVHVEKWSENENLFINIIHFILLTRFHCIITRVENFAVHDG